MRKTLLNAFKDVCNALVLTGSKSGITANYMYQLHVKVLNGHCMLYIILSISQNMAATDAKCVDLSNFRRRNAKKLQVYEGVNKQIKIFIYFAIF